MPADWKRIGQLDFQAVGEKYLEAVLRGAEADPWIIPTLGGGDPALSLLERLDGILLTGSHSNLEPSHYGEALNFDSALLDPRRDAMTLPLIRAAIDEGVPLFAICRGFQEMNVAFGGTLFQRVHEQPGYRDHREPSDASLDVQYGPAHAVQFEPGGYLTTLTGRQAAEVNSLHGQGVASLGAGLTVEARASDGLIEAVRVSGAEAFALGVQWHPEWKVREDPVSLALFQAFGEACRERAGKRR